MSLILVTISFGLPNYVVLLVAMLSTCKHCIMPNMGKVICGLQREMVFQEKSLSLIDLGRYVSDVYTSLHRSQLVVSLYIETMY